MIDLAELPPVTPESTIRDLLAGAARREPNAPALVGTDGSALSYGGLLRGVDVIVSALRDRGVRPGDRIALVLPNGLTAATMFLGAASAGVACPLNPASRRADFDFAFADLEARTLVTDSTFDSPAAAAALARGMRVVDVAELAAPVELGTESAKPRLAESRANSSAGSDIALILHTSGTTAKPKMVPLSHANLCASAANIAAWLALSASDRCLNVMPLFHIHGLVGALLSSIAAGASTVCTEGFVSPDFFAHLRTYQPTWYTAVPTMHQSILARAETEPAPGALRFVRSSSAALPPPTARALARLFAAPVIEAYGMTEAAHQMCSNPLAPGAQRYGSVGFAAGPEVAILGEHGARLANGTVGEVAIRGSNVTAGYIAEPAVNAAAFAGDWFRTGDLGRFDSGGYLYLEGRIKELINRGGEKISPREIDDVLMNHPAVAQAVTFPIPDERLGEEIGAAVVLRPGVRIEERGLIRFAADALAQWKVPRRIVIVTELPKGPTGKLVRLGLAELLDLRAPVSSPASSGVSPATSTVSFAITAFGAVLAEIWCDVLKIGSVDADADFLALGGDSVLAGQVIARVRQRCGRELSILAFFECPTLSSMALAIAESAAAVVTTRSDWSLSREVRELDSGGLQDQEAV